MAREDGIEIKQYYLDNGIFALQEFKERCDRNKKRYSFSGVEAKHQNRVAEQNIQTVTLWARANMLHLATHWPQHANSSF
jgi:hypothetical protein